MNVREFMRFHLLKALLVFIVLQIVVVAIVQNYNHPPLAQSDQASVIEGRKVKITPLFNDTDKDETDELSIAQVSKPIHGTVDRKVNLLYYLPDNNFVGTDSFTYTIGDGRKESKSATITVKVNKNLEPVCNRDISEVYQGGTVWVDVLKNDMDREGDSVFIQEYSQPMHGKLNKVGNKFVYISTTSQADADSFMYTLSDGKSSSKQTAVFIDVRSKSHPCYPWISNDVGDAAIPGKFSCVNNTFVIEASGSDIWNNADGFRYAYQFVNGDCEMYTKVESIEGTNEWAKAGIMIRESLSAGSKVAFVCVTTRNGVTYHRRVKTDDSMEGANAKAGITAPYWVKLTRKGATFEFYLSANGMNWESMGKIDIAMAGDVYIGFAVTSHNNSEIAKAVFSNFRMTGKLARY